MAQSSDTSDVDPQREALLGVLANHRVVFVLIGGAAIQSHGRRYDTLDIDLTPSTDQKNLSRLAAALNELDCRLVTDPADIASWVTLPSDYFTSRTLLAASVWNLATRHGQLDITFAPAGFPGGYADLAPRATLRPAAGTTIVVSVAALDDVHESKRQADRPKDREYLQAGRVSVRSAQSRGGLLSVEALRWRGRVGRAISLPSLVRLTRPTILAMT